MDKRAKVIDMFFNKNMTCEEIARDFHVTVQAINKMLNSTNEYKEYCIGRKTKTDDIKINILNSFFIEDLKIKDIAAKNNVSAAYVSKVIKKDERYAKEKLKRKMVNKNKHENDKRLSNRRKRIEISKEESIIFSNLVALQEQNAKAMSVKKKINGDQMIKINLQHYRYDRIKKRLEYDNTAGVLPQGISKIKYDAKY